MFEIYKMKFDLKRLFDLTIASFLLLLLLMPLIILILTVKIKNGGPIFFKQFRPGLCGVPFEMIKFRTMTDVCGPDGKTLPDSLRLTPFGRFMRSTSIDELPELWNVLRGDMSLVGPRPLLVDYLPLYSVEQNRRHCVRPGITGWAQVNGRNAITWEDKFTLDVWYVDNYSFWLDIKILYVTMKKVLLREGISAAGEATMPRFTGNKFQK